MRGAMDRVNVHGCGNVETGLFEPETKPAGPGEKVDPNWSCHAGPSIVELLANHLAAGYLKTIALSIVF